MFLLVVVFGTTSGGIAQLNSSPSKSREISA